jgi:tetratricopeptide (TPR) repeat protein
MRTPSRGVILAISSLSIIFVMATSGLAQDGVYEKALAKYKEGDFRGAAALLAAKSPKTSGDYNLLGWARLKDGKEDDAVKQFEFSLSLDTSAYNSYCGLGYAYYRKGKFAAAAGYFKKGMRRDPECASGHYEALKKLSAEAAGKNAGPAKPAPPPGHLEGLLFCRGYPPGGQDRRALFRGLPGRQVGTHAGQGR